MPNAACIKRVSSSGECFTVNQDSIHLFSEIMICNLLGNAIQYKVVRGKCKDHIAYQKTAKAFVFLGKDAHGGQFCRCWCSFCSTDHNRTNQIVCKGIMHQHKIQTRGLASLHESLTQRLVC